jgi:hypothetical protein
MDIDNLEFYTDNDKAIKIYRIKNTGLYCAKFSQGGQLPPELTGMYTSPALVKEAIAKYLDRMSNKKKTTAKV